MTISTIMENLDWIPVGENPEGKDDPSIPYATHEGIWNFMDMEIRCYRLNTGKTVIHEDDICKLLGILR